MITLMDIRTQSLLDETELARQAISDAEAFAELYRRHVTRVYRYHIAHTGNIKDAEDLTSQTFLAALEGIRSFRGDAPFAAWLMGIASRRRALFFRGRRHEVPLEAALHLPHPAPPTDKAAALHLQIETVARTLRQISPDRAEAIILHFFGGLKHAEVANVLGRSEAAVKMLIARGLQDLRKQTSLALEVEE
ncbi:MAG TPA: RNA polymerase sigma factor [Anaerolineales bacterium]|nr:RNA polymerase sigma factor [Anaerolineales bacterium]